MVLTWPAPFLCKNLALLGSKTKPKSNLVLALRVTTCTSAGTSYCTAGKAGLLCRKQTLTSVATKTGQAQAFPYTFPHVLMHSCFHTNILHLNILISCILTFIVSTGSQESSLLLGNSELLPGAWKGVADEMEKP